MSNEGYTTDNPKTKQVKREVIVNAISTAIARAGFRVSVEERAKLRTVAATATRLAVGSNGLFDKEGQLVQCPLVEAGLWDEMNAAAQHRFYRSFDTTMGPGFVILEVVK